MSANFGFTVKDANLMNALALAFVGDAVYERYVREIALTRIPGAKVNKLHRVCAAAVNAKAQAEILSIIAPSLTEDEQNVVQRGKNSKPHKDHKNAKIEDYLHATAFEALIGYLELSGKDERLSEVLLLCKQKIESFIDESGRVLK